MKLLFTNYNKIKESFLLSISTSQDEYRSGIIRQSLCKILSYSIISHLKGLDKDTWFESDDVAFNCKKYTTFKLITHSTWELYGVGACRVGNEKMDSRHKQSFFS